MGRGRSESQSDRAQDRSRLAAVTGGGSGIRRTSALRRAHASGDVAVMHVRDERGADVVEVIERFGGRAGFVHLHVSDKVTLLEAMYGAAR